jgi:hypothetical protein
VDDPDVARVADQGVPLAPPPLAEQAVALEDDQVKVKGLPVVTEAGSTDSMAVGGGGALTVTVVCALALP